MFQLILDAEKLKPSVTNCSVKSTGSQQYACNNMMHNVTLQWRMTQEILEKVECYYFYCKCSDYETEVTKMVSVIYHC